MRNILCCFIIILIELNAQLPASAYVYNDSTYQIKKHPWRAGLETIGLRLITGAAHSKPALA